MHQKHPGDRRGSRADVDQTPIHIVHNGDRIPAYVVDCSLDGVGVAAAYDIPVCPGENLQVITGKSVARFAVVRHAGQHGEKYRLGLTWKCAHYRDLARNLCNTPSQEAHVDCKAARFRGSLPAVLYSLWQAFEAGRSHVTDSSIEQLMTAAGSVGCTNVVTACQEVRCLLAAGDSSLESLNEALDRLSIQCLSDASELLNKRVSAAEASHLLRVDEPLSSGASPNPYLGAPTWAVGTAVVLVGHLFC